MKKLLLFGSMLLSQGVVLAQDRNDAFVYIQGDKQTPIYVKMEGEMQVRYSKNFVILNGLASGPLNLEVLFQQNTYPTQKFVLNIPTSSQRAFILKKVDNSKFALYDLNSGHYITSGNKLEDDVITTDPNKDLQELMAANQPATAETTPAVTSNNNDALPDFPTAKPEKKTKVKKPKSVKVTEGVPETVEPVPEETAPVVAEQPAPPKDERFLSFEMQKQQEEKSRDNRRKGNRREETPSAAAEEGQPKATAKSSAADCAEGMDERTFNNFAQQLANRTDEETRLSYVIKYGKNYCFTTEQVRVVAMGFASQSSRYEVARVLKPKVVDADQYEQLLTLFNTNYLKQRFTKEVVGK